MGNGIILKKGGSIFRFFKQAFLSWQPNSGFFFRNAYLSFKDSNYKYSILKRNFELRKTINNQRVLIIGSGLSANELSHIPEDVKILTCNIGPRILLNKGINRKIDLYFCATLMGGHKNENVMELLSKCKINLFIIKRKDLRKNWVNVKKVYHECIRKCIKDSGNDNYYLNKLIGPDKLGQIQRDVMGNRWTSSGLRLLQYALYFQAKEIYIIGVDIDEEGYFWGRKNVNEHLFIDRDFIEIVSRRYKHIYSAAKNSPITHYLKYKPLF